MKMRTRRVHPEIQTRQGLLRLINRDRKELNALEDEDLQSVWSFFKFLCTDEDDLTFVTPDDSLIAQHRRILTRRWRIPILPLSEFTLKLHRPANAKAEPEEDG